MGSGNNVDGGLRAGVRAKAVKKRRGEVGVSESVQKPAELALIMIIHSLVMVRVRVFFFLENLARTLAGSTSKPTSPNSWWSW